MRQCDTTRTLIHDEKEPERAIKMDSGGNKENGKELERDVKKWREMARKKEGEKWRGGKRVGVRKSEREVKRGRSRELERGITREGEKR